MICRIRAGSLTTDSLSAIGLCPAMAASVSGSVTVQPWSRKSPVSSSMNTAGQWSPPVSGSIPMKRSAMRFPLLVTLRRFAPSSGSPGSPGKSRRGNRQSPFLEPLCPGRGIPATVHARLTRPPNADSPAWEIPGGAVPTVGRYAALDAPCIVLARSARMPRARSVPTCIRSLIARREGSSQRPRERGRGRSRCPRSLRRRRSAYATCARTERQALNLRREFVDKQSSYDRAERLRVGREAGREVSVAPEVGGRARLPVKAGDLVHKRQGSHGMVRLQPYPIRLVNWFMSK